MHPSENAITDYVDGTLDPTATADIDRHLESCPSCRRLVDDMREIKGVAASLELREPPIRSWTRLERAVTLEAETRSAQRAQSAPPSVALHAQRAWRSRGALGWLAAAAVLLVATGVGLKLILSTPPPSTARTAAPSSTAPNASANAAAQSVEAELRQAEDHYEKAIKGLEQIASAEQNVFDPKTAATLQKNLAVIDQAISESRAALRVEPTSEPAQQSLLESFKAKMALLQDTVALINEMRKGNDAGAARIVSGLKQKGA
jgi:anti-sigma factor RsiW